MYDFVVDELIIPMQPKCKFPKNMIIIWVISRWGTQIQIIW